MIYIDFFIRATQERHFYKFEGDSFEITELHIGRNNYEWTGRERDETHSIPIRFTLKTNLGEYHNFDIDCGYTEGKDFKKLNYRHYKMSYFSIMEEKDGLYVLSETWDDTNHIWNTDYNYHDKIMQYFNNKIKADTDFIKKRIKELKKMDNMKTDF